MRPSGRGHGGSEAPAGGEPVNAPLRQRPWRPETRMKARASNDKQIRPGHHADATCRCVRRLHPEIKAAAAASRLSFITHPGSGARALPFHWTKDPLYELTAVHGEQMLSKAYLFFFFPLHTSVTP